MKRLLLLLASGSVAFSMNAQERVISVRAASDKPFTIEDVKKAWNEKMQSSNLAYKTTAAPRWYNYASYFETNEAALSSTTDASAPYLWRNNNVLMTFSGTPPVDTNNLVSYGMVCDPAYGNTDDGFNDFDYYPGLMKITSGDTYTVDSIAFSGAYLDNPTRTSVDTFRVSFVYGNGGGTGQNVFTTASTIGAAGTILTNYGATGSILNNHRMMFNPTTMTALAVSGGPTVYTYDIIVDNGATPPTWTADTTSTGLYVKIVPCGINVPAGNMIAASVSHLSGDVVPMWDTVFKGSPANPPVKYNMFRPTMVHRGTSASPAFPTYLAADRNNGVFVDKLTTNNYVPQWFWSSGTSAATVQYPDIAFKISCASCGVVEAPSGVKNVTGNNAPKAYPNPANAEVNIPFYVPGATNVTITLNNLLGQVVASQTLNNTNIGKATFNTASLPAGVYVYNVVANGQRTSGRVSVAH